MESDSFEPMFGINKELNLQFMLGYAPDEFADTLRNIAEGNIKSPQILKETIALGKAQLYALDKVLFTRPNWYAFLQKKIMPPQ